MSHWTTFGVGGGRWSKFAGLAPALAVAKRDLVQYRPRNRHVLMGRCVLEPQDRQKNWVAKRALACIAA